MAPTISCRGWFCYTKAVKSPQWLRDSVMNPISRTRLEMDSERCRNRIWKSLYCVVAQGLSRGLNWAESAQGASRSFSWTESAQLAWLSSGWSAQLGRVGTKSAGMGLRRADDVSRCDVEGRVWLMVVVSDPSEAVESLSGQTRLENQQPRVFMEAQIREVDQVGSFYGDVAEIRTNWSRCETWRARR